MKKITSNKLAIIKKIVFCLVIVLSTVATETLNKTASPTKSIDLIKAITARSNQFANPLEQANFENRNDDGYLIDTAIKDFTTILAAFDKKQTNNNVYHLFTHGKSGQLFIDGKWKNPQEIANFLKPLIKGKSYLNIYGCEFAKGNKGKKAVSYLETVLNISIAASTNITGADGDWVLEYGSSKSISIPEYSGNLQVSGVINSYTEVTAINGASDVVSVTSSASYTVGDRVLIIQMQGAIVDVTNTPNYGSVLDLNNVGNFELGTISSISGNDITLTTALGNAYDVANGSVQLITVPSFTGTVTSTGALTASAWNGSTGGVFVIEADVLSLNHNIDVSGLGFRRGTQRQTSLNTTDYVSTSGAQKGEGASKFSANGDRLAGNHFNGGGGGNWVNHAGAGGSNYGFGGDGGTFGSGLPGKALSDFCGPFPLIMGGGGGAGDMNDGQAAIGANGGGIIIIYANVIDGNSNSIISNGNNGPNSARDGGGGAGGAGSLALPISTTFMSPVNITLNGGNGGNNSQSHSSGGGGGGGHILYTSNDIFSANVTVSLAGGPGGVGGGAGGDGSEGGYTRMDYLGFSEDILAGQEFYIDLTTDGIGDLLKAISDDSSVLLLDGISSLPANAFIEFVPDDVVSINPSTMEISYISDIEVPLTLTVSARIAIPDNLGRNGCFTPFTIKIFGNDSDADGIDDYSDLDDDNDGVLDVLEMGCAPTTADHTTITTVGSQEISGTFTSGSNTADYTIDLSDAAVALVTGEQSSGTGVNWVYDDNTVSPFTQTIMISPNGESILGDLLFGPNVTGNQNGNGDNQAQDIELNWNPPVSATIIDPDNQLNVGGTDIVDGMAINTGTTITQVANLTESTATWYIKFNTLFLSSAFELSTTHEGHSQEEGYSMLFSSLCGTLDTDGDDIPNHLDLDSDGDGCPDAIEGGGGFVIGDLLDASMVTDNQLQGGNNNDGMATGYIGLTTVSVFDNLGNMISTDPETLGIPDDAVAISVNGQTVLNGQSPVLNACLDSDGDSYLDLVDLDDDNDGILDAVESPDCYYTAAEASTLTSITSDFMSPDDFINLYDSNTTATTFNFDNNQPVSANTNWFILEFPSAIELTEVTIGDDFANAGTSNLVGSNDGVTWTVLTSTPVANTSTTGVYTVDQNGANYLYYAIQEATGSTTVSGDTVREITYTVDDTNYIPSANPKPVCTADNDSDGIFNHLDLDSDGDGCPDALENDGGFTDTNLQPATTNFTDAILQGGNNNDGMATGYTGSSTDAVLDNLSGNVSAVAATLGVPDVALLISANGQGVLYSQSTVLNFCVDSDGDSYLDLVDLDDDNDGILDAVESPNCFYTAAEASTLTSITSNFTSPDDFINLYDSNTVAATFNFDASQTVNTDDNWFILEFPFAIELTAVTIGDDFANAGTSNLVGSMDGITWTVLTSTPVANTSTTGVYTVDQNAANYLYYAIQEVTGSTTIAADTVREITYTVNEATYIPSANPKEICTADNDNDGILNHLDLDSDGDDCPDAVEGDGGFAAGDLQPATTNFTDATLQGGNNNDGMATGYTGSSTDAVLDNLSGNVSAVAATLGVPDAAVLISANGQGILYSQSTVLNFCVDSDGDSYGDLVDLDDDNDGILDAIESPDCFYTAAEASTLTNISSDFTSPDDFINLYDSNATAATFNFDASQTVNTDDNWFILEFPFAIELTAVTIGDDFANAGTSNLVGSMDGITWTVLTSTPVANTSTTGVYTVDQNAANYLYYAIQEVTGSTTIAADTVREITYTVNEATYIPSANPKEICTADNDNDGILNHLDLDSDGDDCPDAVEGDGGFAAGDLQPATTNFTDATLQGGNNNDGMATGYTGSSTDAVLDNLSGNVSAVAATLGVPDAAVLISANGQGILYSQSTVLNFCVDSDGDSYGDLVDLDDDNDGILDAVESPSCFVSLTEAIEIDTITTPLNIQAGETTALLFDGAPTQTFNFLNAQSIALDGEVFTIIPKYVVPLTSITIDDRFLNSPSEAHLWGSNDGSTYFQLTTTAVDADLDNQPKVFTIDQNIGTYSYYQIRTVDAETTNSNMPIGEITLQLDESMFIPSAYPKETCTADNDNDGILNHLDLDSDGDGCPDAIEGDGGFDADTDLDDAATNFTDATLQGGNNNDGMATGYTGTSTDAVLDNLSGAVSTAPATLGVPTLAGTGQAVLYSQSSTLNSCADSDGDGYGDLVDLDDDNDGILDIDESTCSSIGDYTNESTAINVGGLHLANADFPIGAETLNFDLVLTSSPTWYRVDDAFSGSTFDFVSYNNVLPVKEDYTFTMPANNQINGSILYGPNVTGNDNDFNNQTTPANTQMQLSWSTGVTAIMHDPDNQTSINDGDPYVSGSTFSAGGTINTRTWYIEFQLNNYFGEFSLVVDYVTAPNWFGSGVDMSNLSLCVDIDTDNDGIPNRLDLDSDGDGCPDAIEGDGGFDPDTDLQDASTVTDNQLQGGNSGGSYTGTSTDAVLDNLSGAVSTDPATLGVPTAAGTGQGILYSQIGDLNVCDDFDNDGIPDLIDIDDDNDGIPDQVECPNVQLQDSFTGTTANAPNGNLPDGWDSVRDTDLVEVGNTINGFTFTAANDSQDGGAVVRFYANTTNNDEIFREITGFVIGNYATVEFEQAILSNSAGSSGYLEVTLGTTTINAPILTAPTAQGMTPFETVSVGPFEITSPIMTLNLRAVSLEDNQYTGGTEPEGTDILIDGIEVSTILTATTVDACNTDGTGLPNYLDTDSDDDGCSDALEAGATVSLVNGVDTFQFTDANTGSTVGTNGLYDVLETSPDSGEVGYIELSGYRAYDDAYNACIDTDGDGIGDLSDMDDDNDGILDTEEGGCDAGSETNPNLLGYSPVVFDMSLANRSTYTAGDANGVGSSQLYTNVGTVDGQAVDALLTVTAIEDATLTVSLNDASGALIILNGASSTHYADVSLEYFETGTTTPIEVATSLTFTDVDNTAPGEKMIFNKIELVSYTTYGSTNMIVTDLGDSWEFSSTASGSPTDENLWITANYIPTTVQEFRVKKRANVTGYNFTVASGSSPNTIDFMCAPIDTDGDGIPNHLDLDSDGDGCPDAVEGDGDIILSALDTSSIDGGNMGPDFTGTGAPVTDNITTSNVSFNTNTFGVPNDALAISPTGQTTGFSQAASINMCDDNDNDNIPDFVDLDDDNDGILDADEKVDCGFTAAWSSSTVGTDYVWEASVSSDLNIRVTMFNGATYWDASGFPQAGTFDSTCQAINSNYGVVPGSAGLQTAVGGQAANPPGPAQFMVEYLDAAGSPVTIENPIMHWGGIGGFDSDKGSGNRNGSEWTLTGGTTATLISSFQDFELINAGTTIRQGGLGQPASGFSNCATGEASGTIMINGAVSSYTFDIVQYDSLGNIDFTKGDGIDFIFEVDFDCGGVNNDIDGDGIDNHLDLDSDGDGCPDAVEAGILVSTTELQSGDVVNGDGTSNTTTTIGGAQFDPMGEDDNGDGLNDNVDTDENGMTDYTSTYATDALDDSIANCLLISIDDFVFDEGVGTAIIPIVLSTTSLDPVVIEIMTSTGTAGTSDYTETTTTVTIPAGSTSIDVSIPITDDGTDEPSEDFVITGTVTSSNTSNTATSGTITITDNDATPTVSIDPLSFDEGVGTATIPVTIDVPSSVDTVIEIITSTGTAGTSDYTETTTTVTIPAGSTSIDVTIPILEDGTDEPSEDFVITGTVTSSNTSNTATSGTITITDNDATPTVSIDPLSFDEGVGTATIPVTIDVPSSVDTVIEIITSTGTAGTSDYTETTTTVTIPAGSTSIDVTIPILEDGTDEPSEDFVITGTVTSSNTSNTATSGAITITDNDATPTVSIDPLSFDEGVGTATIPVTIDVPSSVDTVIEIITSTGTAGTSDYTETTTTVTIPAGSTSIDVTIPILEDGTDEPSEDFVITGTVTSSNTSNTATSGTITITDNEATPTVSIDPLSFDEGVGTATIPVTIDVPSSVDTVIEIITSTGTAGTSDYTETTTTVTIPAGSTSIDVTIPILEDGTDEPSEDFVITGTITSSNTSNTATSGTITITDNDATPTVSIDPLSFDEGVGTATIPVTIDVPSSVDTVIEIITSTGTAGTSDYTETTTTVTIPAGSTSIDVTIPILEDGTDEPSEDFVITGTVTSSNTSNTATSGAITITDNDATPTVSIDPLSFDEGVGTATIPVTIDVPSSVDTVIEIITSTGTAGTSDYTETTTTVTIPAGSTSIDVTIPILEDGTDEPSEDFVITGTVTSSNTSNTATSGTITITDNEATPTVSIDPLSFDEGVGTATIPVTIDVPSSVDTVIEIITSTGTAGTSDYTETTTTVTIPAGSTSIDVTIPILEDGTDEPSEDFVITGTITSSNTSNTATSGTITITDNDATPTVSIDPLSFDEGVGTATIPVTIDVPSSVDTVIEIITSTGTAGTSDYTETTTTVTIPAGQTSIDVTIPILEDGTDEPSEDFVITGTVTSSNTSNTATSGTITITDNDATPTVSIDPLSFDEGVGTATIPVTIDVPSSVDTVIEISTSTGTAGTSDYTETTTTVTIPAGQTSIDVTIPITDDNDQEPQEDFTINANVTSSNTSNTSTTATISIFDNDYCAGTAILVNPMLPGTVAQAAYDAWAAADCDGDGETNGTEVTNGTLPFDPCSVTTPTAQTDPNMPGTAAQAAYDAWAAGDCDGDGETNGTEVTNGTLPFDPCSVTTPTAQTDPNMPGTAAQNAYDAWAAGDCDGDGETNGTEVTNGTLPFDPCSVTTPTAQTDPNMPGTAAQNAYDAWAAGDCDGDGETNGTEVTNGTLPFDPCSVTTPTAQTDPNMPGTAAQAAYDAWAAGDCDGDGETNGTEVTNGTLPFDPCSVTTQTAQTDPNMPGTAAQNAYDAWAAGDCDGDGETNGTEVTNGTLPFDPCSVTTPTAQTDPNMPGTAAQAAYDAWAAGDCDGDGETNGTEVTNGTLPFDPCSVTTPTAQTDPNMPGTAAQAAYDAWAAGDCDGDGETNGTEVTNGTLPFDPCSVTTPTAQTDPNMPGTAAQAAYDAWAAGDCDGDGETNGTEVTNGTLPFDPCSVTTPTAQTDPNMPGTAAQNAYDAWAAGDCDGDGETNGTEVTNGTLPFDPCSVTTPTAQTDPNMPGTAAQAAYDAWAAGDCDGDGETNGTEVTNGTLPFDPCSVTTPTTQTDPNMPGTAAQAAYDAWAAGDCDGDGETNGTEVTNGTLPFDPCSVTTSTAQTDPNMPGTAAQNAYDAWAAGDCDGDGETNGTEVTNGTLPFDPCSVTTPTAQTDPNMPGTAAQAAYDAWAAGDCDGDGETNGTEVTNGTLPFDPCSVTTPTAQTDPNMPGTAAQAAYDAWAAGDCDGDGETNGTEVTNGTLPFDPCSVTTPTAQTDPNMPGTAAQAAYDAWAAGDCDGDGETNGTEVTNGTLPFDPCSVTTPTAQTDPNMPGTAAQAAYDAWAAGDCDGDGETNGTEVTNGTLPFDPCSVTTPTAQTDPNMPGTAAQAAYDAWAAGDCDGDGETNGTEVTNGTLPFDPCSVTTQTTQTDPNMPGTAAQAAYDAWAAGDCDGDGETNGTEVTNGTLPFDPCSVTTSTAQTDPNMPGTAAQNAYDAWAAGDCDGDGETNGTEVTNGTLPFDPCSVTTPTAQTDPNMPGTAAQAAYDAWAAGDCDGDGETNGTEVTNGTLPFDPCSVTTPTAQTDPNMPGTAAQAAYDAWAAGDCDGDGETNGTEVTNGTLPFDPCSVTTQTAQTDPNMPGTAAQAAYDAWAAGDCDGDGETNGTEVTNGTLPFDPCSVTTQISQTDPNMPGTAAQNAYDAWAAADCDGDGETNGEEAGGPDGDPTTIGDNTDPFDSCDYTSTPTDPNMPGTTEQDVYDIWAAEDCDGDGVSNGQEVIDMTGVNDPCDLISGNIDSPITTTAICDTDGDGVLDNIEIMNGTDPNNPCSYNTVDITQTQAEPWISSDCDGDGETNGEEAGGPDGDPTTIGDNTDPFDPCSVTIPTVPVDPNMPGTAAQDAYDVWANADCDGDGASNIDEVTSGVDDPSTDWRDPCDLNLEESTMPTSEWDALDCDRDGVPNGIEYDYGDTDGDGLPNFNDPDDDNDGVDTINEDYGNTEINEGDVSPIGDGDPTNDDTDGDGIPDYLDNDDDDDGILTIDENADPDDDGIGFGGNAFDSNGNGLPDYLEEDNGVLPEEGIDLEVFNAVTPNSDGDNDVFTIDNIEAFPDNTVRIYNRWGVLVYEVDGYGQNGQYFSGVSNGRVTISKEELLPVGTYYYILTYVNPNSGETKEQAGYLYIQR